MDDHIEWLGHADIETYKASRLLLTEADTKGWSNDHISHLNAMIRECDYAIEWLETGRRPGNKRGVERLAAYQREIPFELMERYAAPPAKIVLQTDIGANQEYIHMEYILTLLSDRERECYEMHIGGMLNDQEIADTLGLKRRTVREFLSRAEKKVNTYRKKPMPLLLDIVV